MALKSIRFQKSDGRFHVGDSSFSTDRDERLILPLDLVEDVSASQLAKAIEVWGAWLGVAREIYFSSVSWPDFDPDDTLLERTTLTLTPGTRDFKINAYLYLAKGVPFEEQQWRTLVEPLLDEHQAAWDGSWTDDDYAAGLAVGLVARVMARGRSVREVFAVGDEMQDLVDVATGAATLTPTGVCHLVQGQQVAALVGQSERSWLDAKAAPYPTKTTLNKLELAKDVAAFANTAREAVIVVGLRTESGANGDVIKEARPFKLSRFDVPTLERILADWIVPPILDLEIELVETRSDYGFGLIWIPAQDKSLLPVLVTGAVAGGSFIGTHVSIPMRAGQRTVFADPARIHSLIAAGRAALSSSPNDDVGS